MERVVDGPQGASWAPGLETAMNLRGQKVDMIMKPTTSVYAPSIFHPRLRSLRAGKLAGSLISLPMSSGGVKIEFEGPSFEMKVYTAADPAALVRAHALDAGPPFHAAEMDVHALALARRTHATGHLLRRHAVTGPFNSEIMEDVLMMKAFGIPNGVYWIDRPWGPGKPWGYDDFEIDEKRLPNFAEMVKWLDGQQTQDGVVDRAVLPGQDGEGSARAKATHLPGRCVPPTATTIRWSI